MYPIYGNFKDLTIIVALKLYEVCYLTKVVYRTYKINDRFK